MYDRLFRIAILITFLISSIVYAEPWKISIQANLGINQNQFSDNWKGGAASSFSWISSTNSVFEKQLIPAIDMKNTLKLEFGQTHTRDLTNHRWQVPTKSNDLIDFESLYRLTRGWVVDPFVAGRLESEFIDQSNPQKTYNFDPWRITESAGAARTLYKHDKTEANIRLGVAFREYSDYALYDTSSHTAQRVYDNDGGIQLDADYKTPASDRLDITSKLTVFKAVYNSNSDKLKGLPNANYWKYPTVNWENTLTGHLTDFLAVNLGTQLLYDKQIDLAGQFKETLTLGLTYLFKR